MVRTRFAPSPTGYLHIGGVRTALFNWLFAKQHGGQFILRIDDTDQQRNQQEALAPILHGFRWLGIDWNEGAEVGGDHGPYYQSEKSDSYQAAAAKLIESGYAYYDFATPEELQEERRAAEKAGTKFIYSRRFAAHTEQDRQRYTEEGRAAVVRLKMPREGHCEFFDHVRGDMSVAWAGEQDHVIQRADGSCLYHLANVVDDHDMKITHVIRAEEHLSNTPRQIFIAQGLGYDLPQYAHLPFVAEPGSKNKLSKRKLEKYLKNPDFSKVHAHGLAIAEAIGATTSAESFNPVIVDFYETVGYLPDAIINYLLLLGWSLDEQREDFTRAEMIEHFSLERVNRAAASFDAIKLVAFQERRMLDVPIEEKVERCHAYLEEAGLWPVDGREQPFLEAVVREAAERLKVFGDILDYRDFFLSTDAIEYDPKAVQKRLRAEGAAETLAAYRTSLAEQDDFSISALESHMRGFAEERGIKLGQIIHAARVAVTGKAVGFGMFETLSILGRASCLARLDRAMALATAA